MTIYKVLLLLQKWLNKGKERALDPLIAGGLGGWYVFGERTAVSFPTPTPVFSITGRLLPFPLLQEAGYQVGVRS